MAVIYLFSMAEVKGTTFKFSVDSQTIGYYDMRTSTSSLTEFIFALSEEGYCAAPFFFEPVSFQSGMQVLKGGGSGGRWLSPNLMEAPEE
ncbi:MAG: hypothetical protein ACREBS_08650 [Nitrososphaerales archaeon]